MKCRKFLKSHVSTLALFTIVGLLEAAVQANAAPVNACTQDASGNLTCSGAIVDNGAGSATSLPITLYDVAAKYQPSAGGNAYTPSTYSSAPAPLMVTIQAGALLTAAITTANAGTYLADNGLISANYSNTENPAVNNVQINNSGAVNLSNSQYNSRAAVFNADSQVNNFVVNNNGGGSVSVIQTGFTGFSTSNLSNVLSVSKKTAPVSVETANYSGAALAITTDFYSDDNTNEFTVNNSANSSVLATGNYASAYYGRADTTITNNGTISNTTWSANDTIAAGHWAIVAFAGTDYATAPNTNPDNNIVLPNSSGLVTILDTSALNLTNNNTIKGDIVALDITPLVYAAAVGNSTNPFPNPTQSILNLPVASSSAGPRDSNIQNNGSILGNLYLGSGTHVVDNAAGASWQGNVDVDQRPFQGVFLEPTPSTTIAGDYVSAGGADFNGTACSPKNSNTSDAGCATTSGHLLTVVGGQSLTLTNEGTFTGNIEILDQATSVNAVTLTGTGFTGSVIALNGTGSNSLVLDGVTNLTSVQNFSSLDLMQSNVTVAQGVSLVDGSTLATTVFGKGGTMTAPSMNAGSIVGTLTSAGTTTVTPTYDVVVRNGDSYLLATQATGTYVASPGTALVSSSVSNASGALILTANVRNASTVPGISGPGAQTINGLINANSSNPNVQALGIAVEGLGSNAAVVAAGHALSPIVDGAAVQTPINSAMLFQQQIDSRLDQFAFSQLPASGRSADLGVARPVPVYGALPVGSAWIEGIGGGITQSAVNGTNGYSATLVGFVGGYDRVLVPNVKVGGAFGYIDAQVGNNANVATHQRIDTYQGLGYAEYAPGPFYARGSIGYGTVDYASTRVISFPGFNDTATGRHNGNVLTARGEGGVPYAVYGSLVVPYAAFTYTHLSQSGYTEASGAGAGLTYQGVSNDSDRSEIGGKVIVPLFGAPVFSYLFPTGESFIGIEARAAYVHEFGNVGQTVVGAFTGGTFFAVTGPVPNRDMVDFGIGVKMASGPVQLDLSYNGVARSTYYEQVGLLRGRYVF